MGVLVISSEFVQQMMIINSQPRHGKILEYMNVRGQVTLQSGQRHWYFMDIFMNIHVAFLCSLSSFMWIFTGRKNEYDQEKAHSHFTDQPIAPWWRDNRTLVKTYIYKSK